MEPLETYIQAIQDPGIVLVAGIVRMLWAFKADSLGKGIWVFVIGLLTLLAGISLLANPVFAAGMLTIMLVFYFILDGIFELIAGFQLRPATGSGWLIFGGIMSILLGILVGIKLFFVGLIMVAGGSVINKIANEE